MKVFILTRKKKFNSPALGWKKVFGRIHIENQFSNVLVTCLQCLHAMHTCMYDYLL